MATGELTTVVRYLRTVAAPRAAGGVPDGELLRRFAAERDEVAFEALVHRHGPMVLGLCQRVLADAHDAEDAFQATFLLLVRKARTIRRQASVVSWLYGVALRTALRARSRRAERRTRERNAPPRPAAEPEPGDDLARVVAEEVGRLPEKYRLPVLLCHLSGASYDEAARQLGCPKGTVATRLARARERLKTCLARRGVVASGALVGIALSHPARAAVPAALARATVEGAVGALGKTAGAAAVLVRLAGLVGGFGGSVPMSKVSTTAVAVLALGVLAVGPGVPEHQRLVSGPAEPAAREPAHAARPAPATKPTPAPAAPADPARVARRLWAVMEIVRERHLDPCPRADMVAALAGPLYRAARREPPADLHDRAAALQNADAFVAFVEEGWPRDVAGARQPAAGLGDAMLKALLARVHGEVQEIPPGFDQKVIAQISANRYVGIGIQIRLDPKQDVPQVVLTFRRGVARKGGVRENDLLLAVDGKDTHHVPLAEVIQWLRGDEGKPVTIVVRQPGEEPRTIRLVRGVNPVDTVLGYRRAGDGWTYRVDPDAPIAYAWIESLKASTLHELRHLERRLQADGVRALVLDFRLSNGDGGLANAALVADGLLDGGLLWSVRDARGNGREYRADRECLFRGWPLAVLTDGSIFDKCQCAILAALQDNGRAILVGEPTKVGGQVNAIFPIPGERSSVLLPVARLERPANGRGWPVRPDHVVPMTAAQHQALEKWLRAKDLPELPRGTTDQPPADPQLAKAVALLRQALARSGTAKAPAKGG